MQQLFGFTDGISTVLVMLTRMTQMTRMIRISSMTDSEDPESVKGSGFAISTGFLQVYSKTNWWCDQWPFTIINSITIISISLYFG